MTLRKSFEGPIKVGNDMGNSRDRRKREIFMEKKEWLHNPQWIEANKGEKETLVS